MAIAYNLGRFTEAQENKYADALAELKNGRKESHWMWFIFPQLEGLGRSSTAKFYGIKNREEAAQYLQHPLLGARLIELSNILLQIDGKTAHDIFGSPDDLKLKSCMTLFSAVPNADPVFESVLKTYFGGIEDSKTLEIVNAK